MTFRQITLAAFRAVDRRAVTRNASGNTRMAFHPSFQIIRSVRMAFQRERMAR